VDPGLTEVATGSVPRPRLRVVRRRYGDRRFLVDRVRLFALDPLADAVWRACDGSSTVAEIAERVAAAESRPLDEALAATALAVTHFERNGLLALEAPAADGGEPDG
jgi:hypothetical protein